MKRALVLFVIMVLMAPAVQAQYLMIDQSMHRTAASPGGAILKAPVLATDQEFWFPTTGGTLVTTSNFGGWSLSGNDLSGTEVLGSINAFDVHLVSGGTSNVRMTLLNAADAVLLPSRTELRLAEPSDTWYSAIKAPHVQSQNITYVLPYDIPTEPGRRLKVDSVNADTVVFGYTTQETSTDVSFDTKQNYTETNSVVPIDVADMAITVIPNKTYAFEAMISVQHPGANANAEISFALPAGAEMHYLHMELTQNNPQATGNQTEAAEIFAAPGAGQERHYFLKGFVRTNGTGGIVQMRLASTSGELIRLTENSYMQITTN